MLVRLGRDGVARAVIVVTEVVIRDRVRPEHTLVARGHRVRRRAVGRLRESTGRTFTTPMKTEAVVDLKRHRGTHGDPTFHHQVVAARSEDAKSRGGLRPGQFAMRPLNVLRAFLWARPMQVRHVDLHRSADGNEFRVVV